jgi:hypothetical protein
MLVDQRVSDLCGPNIAVFHWKAKSSITLCLALPHLHVITDQYYKSCRRTLPVVPITQQSRILLLVRTSAIAGWGLGKLLQVGSPCTHDAYSDA